MASRGLPLGGDINESLHRGWEGLRDEVMMIFAPVSQILK